MTMITTLPECLLWTIVDCWLGLNSTIILDSALCCQSDREAFLNVLATHTFSCVTLLNSRTLWWIIRRNITTFQIILPRKSAYVNKAWFLRFCKSNADKVLKISIEADQQDNDLVGIIAQTFCGLTHFTCMRTNVYSLSQLLAHNLSMQHLSVTIHQGIVEELPDASLPYLSTLRLNVDCDGELVW